MRGHLVVISELEVKGGREGSTHARALGYNFRRRTGCATY